MVRPTTEAGVPVTGTRLALFICMMSLLSWSVPTGIRAGDPRMEESPPPASAPQGKGEEAPEGIQTPPPPFTEGIFPCSDCHADLPVNRTRRELVDMHDDIVLKHGPKSRWCFDCHDADNRDVLHLVNNKRIPFTKSYLLCGQCHGDKLRDWKAGVHGKRTGYWNGRKTYLLCPSCHNPHSPRFKPIKPKPAPVPPRKITPEERKP